MSNLIVEVEKYGQISDRDGYHLKRGCEISSSSHPQAMHDLVQAPKFDSTILESSGMCYGVEALQRPLMVMPGPRDSGKLVKLNQILFLLHNPPICMVALNVDPHVKNIYYSG